MEYRCPELLAFQQNSHTPFVPRLNLVESTVAQPP